MKLSINNQNTETKNTVANPAAIVAASQTPAEPIQDAVAEEITDEQPVPKRKAASKRGQSGAGSDAAEREQARPEVKATIKRKVTLKKKQPISKTPQAQPMSEAKPSPSTGERGEGPQVRFSVVPYTNKQGETGYFLFGFASQEEAKGLADRMAKSVREGFRYENHVRYDVVGFPPRYAQMAQQMRDALNAGDAAAVAKIAASTFDVYAAAVADGKAESDRKRAERKEAEARAKAKEVAKVKKSAGLYSKEDVAAMLADVLAGKDVPEEIKKLLAA